MTTVDVEKAIKLVMETPRNAVSVPVWNMLLGMIGREGRLELMWKTFNDVSNTLIGLDTAAVGHVLTVIDEETKLQTKLANLYDPVECLCRYTTFCRYLGPSRVTYSRAKDIISSLDNLRPSQDLHGSSRG